jgi:small subunit ribosomal protein S20
VCGSRRESGSRTCATARPSKTLTRRLQSAVADGDQERAAAEHRELVRAIDKASSRKALHRNTAARKKAQAARLLSGS